MPELSPDELLSAYLDGELTAEEQARAERLIADDRQARALFEELRGMRSCLQGLPAQKLPEEFAARVLRAAEQQVLQAPAAAASEAHRADASPARSPMTLPERFRRPLAYVALVLAASLLIAIFNPDAPRIDGSREQVAVAPTAEPVETASSLRGLDTSVEPPVMTAAPGADRAMYDAATPAAERFDVSDNLIVDSPAAKKGGGMGGAGLGIAKDSQARTAADNGLMVVTCEITPTAAREDSFRRLLVRNQISLEEEEAEQVNKPSEPATAPARRETPTQRADEQSGLELIYVEATQQQLEATLADMASQPKTFLSVDVGPTETSLTQNRWQTQYSRGKGGVAQQRFVQPALPPPQVAGAAPSPAASPAGAAAPAAPAKPGEAAKAPASPPATADAVQLSVQNTTGRARAYAMPAEGLNAPRNAEIKQQQQPAIAAGTVEKQNPVGGAKASGADAKKSQAAIENYYAQEPGTLRALFVLRVADEPQPPAEKK